MQNKVGDHTPSDVALGKLLGQLEEVLTALRKFGITLTIDERTRLLHARKNAAEHIDRTVTLANKYHVSIPGIPLDGMKNDVHLAGVMGPFIDLATNIRHLVADTGGEAESEYWQAFLAYYSVLSSMSDRIPGLATEYKATIDFMAHGPRKQPEPGPSKP